LAGREEVGQLRREAIIVERTRRARLDEDVGRVQELEHAAALDPAQVADAPAELRQARRRDAVPAALHQHHLAPARAQERNCLVEAANLVDIRLVHVAGVDDGDIVRLQTDVASDLGARSTEVVNALVVTRPEDRSENLLRL